ncbi:MAG: metallophosphoesterase, partial [Actinomycetota bacterium]
MTPSAACDAGQRLVRFVHLTDVQLADDESPLRVASLDARGSTQSAFRPQEAHMCRVLSAMVRTINALPDIDLVLLGGDNIDNAQSNELDWFLGIMNGGKVDCDSGTDDDPLQGPSNDPKDPFVSAGLAVPWYWVTGNHDIMPQGTVPLTDDARGLAVGDTTELGTRDWSKPGGPVTSSKVIADARRALLGRHNLTARVG